jgi:hypothetical protein
MCIGILDHYEDYTQYVFDSVILETVSAPTVPDKSAFRATQRRTILIAAPLGALLMAGLLALLCITSGTIQTMSLARRAVREGTRALIVDDFLKGGGTAKGMVDLMHEFSVTVVGMAFVMATAAPEKKRVASERSLMTLEIRRTGDEASALVRPAAWLEA